MLAAPQHGPRPLPLFLDLLRRETDADPALREAALRGLRRYQTAPRVARRPAPARRRRGTARLRDHGGSGPPVVFVPSLINPPYVLDLAPGRSLIGWMASQGLRCWSIDWGHPRAADRDLTLAEHVSRRLVPLLRTLEQPPLLVGYCLGGTLALAAAVLLGSGVRGVATIAAPWRFSGYGDAARARMVAAWRDVEPLCRAMGVVPMEVLQSGFWHLDPARTIAKYARFADLPDDAAADFVTLEDWANTGAPLPYAAGRDLFERMVGADEPGRGRWIVDGRAIMPEELACPAAEFVSRTDRIVPEATATGIMPCHLVDSGHVGMVVTAAAKGPLWSPLAQVLRTWSTQFVDSGRLPLYYHSKSRETNMLLERHTDAGKKQL